MHAARHLGFAEPIRERTGDYDEDAIRHFDKGGVRHNGEETEELGDDVIGYC